MAEYAVKTGYQGQPVAETYDSKRFSSIRGKLVHGLELRAVLRALSHAGPTDRILDLPCGTARIMYPLMTKGLDVWGADISWAMLQQAKIKLMGVHGAGGSNRLVRCDAEVLPLADGAFDCVVSLRFMGHLPPETRRSSLREMKRISRRWVVVAFYISDPVFRVKRALRRMMSRPFSAHPVTWEELERDLSAVGLRKVSVFPVARLHLSETHVVLLSVD